MSNATNKPSAWSAYPHGNNGASWGVGTDDGREVATVRTSEADAALIARAPDLAAENAALLERIGALRVALRKVEQIHTGRDNPEVARRMTVNIAREALRADEEGGK